MTLLYTKEQFLKQFNLDQSISFTDFSQQLSVLNGSDTSGQFVIRDSLDGFLAKWAKKDNRLQRLNTYKKNLYQMLVLEPKVALGQWFDKMVALKEPVEYYFQIPNADILTDKTFAGRTNSKYGRISKNINFDGFYNTKKLYNNDFEYTLGLMKAMFEDFKLRNSLAGPAFFDHICNIKDSNYNQFWTDFMVGCNRASIFNPATYKSIIEELFTGETIFAPVMGWNSYQLAFYSTGWKRFIATDVIPEVVNNGKLLHQQFEQYRNNSIVEIDQKTVDLYLCPSEKLNERHDFINQYCGQVDAVLFSPPYFDLEIYPGDDQSFMSFPNYNEWLEGYWAETVKLCAAVMRPGARFGFIISNYVNKAKQTTTISEDMAAVAARYLVLVDQYRVQWSAIAGSRQAKKTRDGNFEDLWLFETA